MSQPISLQLYSLRDDSPVDFPGVIAKVAAMGYDAVEFAGYHGHSASDLRAILDQHGLVCSGTHTGWNLLDDEHFGETIATHATLGTKNIIIPWLPLELHSTADATLELSEKLTELTPII